MNSTSWTGGARYVAALLCTMGSLGCSGSSGGSPSPAAPGDSGSDAAAASTFTQVYTDVISKKCVSCHNPTGIGGMGGKLDMSSQSAAYTNLVGVAAAGESCSGKGTRVTPGQPDMSILYLKVSLGDMAPCGSKMPLGGAMLAQSEADEIQSWITGGAKND
jgi:hypothetical protein